MTLRFIIALITLNAFTSSLLAQQEVNPVDKKKGARFTYVVYSSGSKFFNDPTLIKSGEKITTTQLSRRNASEKIKVHSSGVVDFVKENPNDKKNPYTSYARAIIPENVRDTLIILTPVKEKVGSKKLFSTQVVSLTKFNKGDWLFINHTPKRLGIKIGESRKEVKPKANYIFDAKQYKTPTNLPISYNYYDTAEKKWKLISPSTVVIRPTRREICVFTWRADRKRISYHGITFTEQ